MKRALISALLLSLFTLSAAASSTYEHPPSVNAAQQRQADKAAQKAARKQAKLQKKEFKQQKRDARKANKNRPYTTTS